MINKSVRFVAASAVVLLGAFAFRANRAANAAAVGETVQKINAAVGASVVGTASVGTPTVAAADAVASQQVVVFAGGCFWGVQAVFQHTKGVITARSGYSGGAKNTATYEDVSTGRTGHAESVRVVYDPSKVSYDQLLTIFFSVVHDPTELNMQGPDHGTQYRSVVWTTTPEQKTATEAFIAKLTKEKVFNKPIVTEVQPLNAFYEAEAYHQDYATLHPNDMYIAINDTPKVADLKKQFASLYRTELHQ